MKRLLIFSVKEELAMRKVTFGGATSLDNFIARKDDSVDWLLWTKEVTEIMNELTGKRSTRW